MFMKTILLYALFYFTLFPLEERKLYTNNPHVIIDLKAPAEISSKKSETLSFSFQPIEGVHVNTKPIIEIIIEKNSPFEIIGKPRFSKNHDGYLDVKKTVEFSLKVKNTLQIGKRVLKANMNYFYCSDAEGWCNKFTQPIELNIEIVQ
jgi:hypothetical protein